MFETRIKSLQDNLAGHEIEALLVTSAYNIAFLSGIHAFSVEEREARILVTGQSIFLFTDARYMEMVKDKSPFVKLVEISSENSFSEQLEDILEKENVKSLGFEEENITYKEISDLEEKINVSEFIPTVEIVENIRSTKDNNEVEMIKKACSLSDLGFEYILKQLKPGVTEIEIKAKLENFIRENGGEISFPSIVAFGKNSAIPHHLSSNYKLQTSEIILLDFGAKIGGYASDMTRTVFIENPNEQQKNMYNAVKEAQEVAIDYLKTHMDEGFETKKAAELANSHLKAVGFDKIPHGLGHGVGLQVHELPSLSPYSDKKLIPGMVITIEPGVYIPSLGGVRIEDTALVTTDGIKLLTNSPKDLTIL